MTSRKFWTQTGLLTLSSAILLFGLSFYPPLSPYLIFGMVCLIFFVALSVLMYRSGKKAAVSSQPNLFTQLILIFTLTKMFLSVILVFVFFRLTHPTSNWFLAPFFLIYLIYTIFETYFMIRIGKSTKPKSNE